tara:strand:+ start:392 stop:1393 length:1002 start_codon:yes stop_codon:yes gene_type:complete
LKNINFGIIGTGLMAEIYSDILAQKSECQLVAVTGNTVEKTKKFAKKYNIQSYFNSSYEEMFINHPEIDSVIIATPEWVRIDPVKLSIKYYKNILLEKPFSSNIEDAMVLFEMLKNYKRVFDICHVLRYSPRFSALKKSIDNNDIGQIKNIYARRNSNNERVKRVLGKTDLAFWLTPHDIDIMRWVTNSEVKSVYAFSRNKLKSKDDHLTVNLKFENKVDAVLQILWGFPPVSNLSRQSCFEIWGSEGYIDLEDYRMNINIFKRDNISFSYDTYEEFKINSINKGIFENLISSFIKRVIDSDLTKNNIALTDSFKSIEVCDKISRSIKLDKKL